MLSRIATTTIRAIGDKKKCSDLTKFAIEQAAILEQQCAMAATGPQRIGRRIVTLDDGAKIVVIKTNDHYLINIVAPIAPPKVRILEELKETPKILRHKLLLCVSSALTFYSKRYFIDELDYGKGSLVSIADITNASTDLYSGGSYTETIMPYNVKNSWRAIRFQGASPNTNNILYLHSFTSIGNWLTLGAFQGYAYGPPTQWYFATNITRRNVTDFIYMLIQGRTPNRHYVVKMHVSTFIIFGVMNVTDTTSTLRGAEEYNGKVFVYGYYHLSVINKPIPESTPDTTGVAETRDYHKVVSSGRIDDAWTVHSIYPVNNKVYCLMVDEYGSPFPIKVAVWDYVADTFEYLFSVSNLADAIYAPSLTNTIVVTADEQHIYLSGVKFTGANVQDLYVFHYYKNEKVQWAKDATFVTNKYATTPYTQPPYPGIILLEPGGLTDT